MEPVTHVLTGACLARTGLNRRAAYATLAMAVAAEFPDIDTLWSLRGPVSGFEHHRGITHSFLGLPFEAALLLLLVILLHRIRVGRQPNSSSPTQVIAPLTKAPIRWAVLYGLLLLALTSHLLLDFTNNYGLRPFFPFQSHWYAVFIFDPLIFLLLLAGVLLPSLFGLIAREVGARRQPFHGAGWARAALLCVVGLWLFRAHEHSKAIDLADAQVEQVPAEDPASGTESAAGAPQTPERPRAFLAPQRSLASPDPLSPFRWYTATDFGAAYRLGTADTRSGSLSPAQLLTKPSPSPVLTAAENSRLGRIYLDWSPMPWLSPSLLNSPDPAFPPSARAVVFFQDLRFTGSTLWLQRRGKAPLTGEVVLDGVGNTLEQGMDGHFGR